MTGKNVVLLSLLSILIAAYLFSGAIMTARRKKDAAVLPFASEKIQSFSLYNGEKHLAIRRDPDSFVFARPFSGIAAKKEAVETYFKLLDKLSPVRRLGAIKETEFEDFGISPKAPVLAVTAGDKTAGFALGMRNPVAQGYYLYGKDTGELVLIPEAAAGLFRLRPEDFREKKLFPFDGKDIKSIEIDVKGNPGSTFELAQDEWYATEARGGRRYLCEKAKVAQFIEMLLASEITDFTADDGDYSAAATGLVSPRFALRVSTGAAVTTVTLGSRYNGNMAYAAVDGTVKGGVSALIEQVVSAPASSFAREQLLDFNLSSIVLFTVKEGEMVYEYRKKRGRWYRTGKKTREADEDAVKKLLQTLAGLKIEKYYFDGPSGEVAGEYMFYNRKNELLAGIFVGGMSDGFTRVWFKDKEGAFGIPGNLHELLEK